MNALRWIAAAALAAGLTAPAGAQVVSSQDSPSIGVTPGAPLTLAHVATDRAGQLVISSGACGARAVEKPFEIEFIPRRRRFAPEFILSEA